MGVVSERNRREETKGEGGELELKEGGEGTRLTLLRGVPQSLILVRVPPVFLCIPNQGLHRFSLVLLYRRSRTKSLSLRSQSLLLGLLALHERQLWDVLLLGSFGGRSGWCCGVGS